MILCLMSNTVNWFACVCAHQIATRIEVLHDVIIGMLYDITTPDALIRTTDEASDDDSSTAAPRSSDFFLQQN